MLAEEASDLTTARGNYFSTGYVITALTAIIFLPFFTAWFTVGYYDVSALDWAVVRSEVILIEPLS